MCFALLLLSSIAINVAARPPTSVPRRLSVLDLGIKSSPIYNAPTEPVHAVSFHRNMIIDHQSRVASSQHQINLYNISPEGREESLKAYQTKVFLNTGHVVEHRRRLDKAQKKLARNPPVHPPAPVIVSIDMYQTPITLDLCYRY
jgi:hypothetical protein